MEQFFGEGNGSQIIPVAAGIFQTVAALIAAALATRFYALSGLFAASVSGIIIVSFDLTFGSTDPYQLVQPGMWLASLALLGYGAVPALPVAVCVGWTKTRIARSHSDEQIIGTQFRSAPTPARSQLAWLTTGFVTCLSIAVAVGLIVKIRPAILVARELRALQATAELGSTAAQNRLGLMYLFGQSVPQDVTKAIFWIGKAATAGDAEAENTLGIMYLNGRGVPEDDVSAAQWFRKAAEQDNPNGENDLGNMYFAGKGVPRNDALGVAWFRKSAEQGNADAQNSLGLAYHWGRGASPDDNAAIAWFRKAAEQGRAAAQSNLGMMYRLGLGTPRDDSAAVTWLRKAADQGFAEAQYNLGQIYEQGNGGVTQDEAQAVLLFRKAAGQGYALAAQHLKAACDQGISQAC
jgi:TPR repeat protein